MQVMRYRQCSSCRRLIPYLQPRCGCGQPISGSDRVFKVCPACGLVLDDRCKKCDCGFSFLPPKPKKEEKQVPLSTVVILLLLVISLAAVALVAVKLSAASPSPASSVQLPSSPLPAQASEPAGSPASVPDPDPAPEPIPILHGAIVRTPRDARLCPFSVETSPGANYYIYLERYPKSLESSGSLDASFYITGGRPFSVKVPPGIYSIYYAVGTGPWYGHDLKFGDTTSCFRCDELFTFSHNDESGSSGWTITLTPILDGNMETIPISEEDFPE